MNVDQQPVVALHELKKDYRLERGRLGDPRPVLRAVDGAALEMNEGTTTGLVGESGSGKSTLGRLICGLEEPTSGMLSVLGEELRFPVRGRQRRALRRNLQMVFQDPYSSFDPSSRIGASIAEPLRTHAPGRRADHRAAVREALQTVGLDDGFDDRFPRQMSGGQLQRAAIARALILKPRVIVLDEPVSALDVSTQAQVVNLLDDIQSQMNVAYLFISHDLAVVRHVSDRIAVMYLGRIVEEGPAEEVYSRPKHPYTAALLAAVPRVKATDQGDRRFLLQGEPPSPTNPPSGCRFRTRCPFSMPVCRDVDPPTHPAAGGGSVRCHLHTQGPRLDGFSVTRLNPAKPAESAPASGGEAHSLTAPTTR